MELWRCLSWLNEKNAKENGQIKLIVGIAGLEIKQKNKWLLRTKGEKQSTKLKIVKMLRNIK